MTRFQFLVTHIILAVGTFLSAYFSDHIFSDFGRWLWSGLFVLSSIVAARIEKSGAFSGSETSRKWVRLLLKSFLFALVFGFFSAFAMSLRAANSLESPIKALTHSYGLLEKLEISETTFFDAMKKGWSLGFVFSYAFCLCMMVSVITLTLNLVWTRRRND